MIYTVKGQDIWVTKLAPYDGLAREFLRFLSLAVKSWLLCELTVIYLEELGQVILQENL